MENKKIIIGFIILFTGVILLFSNNYTVKTLAPFLIGFGLGYINKVAN